MLCALSLLLVAFAHRPLSLTDSVAGYSDVDVASFILPDGTLPDLCLPGQDGPYHFSAYHCEACRIVSSVDLPSPFPPRSSLLLSLIFCLIGQTSRLGGLETRLLRSRSAQLSGFPLNTRLPERSPTFVGQPPNQRLSKTHMQRQTP